ncbi:MAG: hypothetical protein ACOC2W_04290 [bacterium]
MEPIKATSVAYKCGNLFYLYSQKEIGVSDLIKGLKEAEEVIKKKNPEVEDGGLWFNFGDEDTTVTTINDLKKDLNLSHSDPNRMFIEEKIGMIVDDPDCVLQVFYS